MRLDVVLLPVLFLLRLLVEVEPELDTLLLRLLVVEEVPEDFLLRLLVEVEPELDTLFLRLLVVEEVPEDFLLRLLVVEAELDALLLRLGVATVFLALFRL